MINKVSVVKSILVAGLVLISSIPASEVKAQVSEVYVSGLQNPTGIVFDGSGNLFVASTNAGIKKIDSSKVSEVYKSSIIGSTNLFIDSAGALYTNAVSDGSQFYRVPAKDVGNVFLGAEQFSHVYVNSAGNVYGANNFEITKFESYTSTIDFAEQIANFSPNNVLNFTGDASGNIFAVLGNGDLKKILSSGTVVNYATGIADAKSIAVDASGVVYVSIRDRGKIVKVSLDGVVSDYITGYGDIDYLAFDAQGNLYYSNT